MACTGLDGTRIDKMSFRYGLYNRGPFLNDLNGTKSDGFGVAATHQFPSYFHLLFTETFAPAVTTELVEIYKE